MDLKKVVTRFWKKTVLSSPKIFENLNNELQEQILNLLPAAEESSENVAWSDAPIVKNSSKNDKDSGLKLRRQLSLKGLEEKEIIGMSWIQCDSCLKWRCVSKQEVHRWCGDDKKWICKFNKDQTKNNCNIEEDNFESIEETMCKKGIVFVYPYLTPGDMVMAIMAGYCWWPAVVSFDPFYNTYVEYQEEEQRKHKDMEEIVVDSYHVEFLGTPHSHAWISSSCIHLLDSNPQSLVLKKYMPKSKGHKSTFRGNSIQGALKEAEIFQKLSKSVRLKRCVFNYTGSEHNTKIGNNNINNNRAMTSSTRKGEHSFYDRSILESSCDNPKLSRLTQVTAPSTTTAPVVTTTAAVTVAAKFQDTGAQESYTHCSHSLVKRQHFFDSEENIVSEYIESSSVGSGTSTVYEASGYPKTPRRPCSDPNIKVNQSNSTTVMTRFTKNPTLSMSLEEKLTQDIENYHRHEADFSVDLKKFLTFNNMDLEVAVWENITIDPYQFYCVVLDAGGYNNVTEKMKWAVIYREVTNTLQKNRGRVARSYYERNLLAYEIYKSGNVKIRHDTTQPKTKSKRKVPAGWLNNNNNLTKYSASDVISDTPAILEHFMLVDQYSTSYQFEYEIFQETENKVRANLRDYIDPSSYRTPDTDYQILLGDITSIENFTTYTEGNLNVPDIGDAGSIESVFSLHNNDNNNTETNGNRESHFAELKVLQNQIEDLDFMICL
ncbi:uncharacterized protein LOC118768051 isoform X2 [Octopus sinensis]|uniref:Uncharacterized protein LOC118768051 isoform X2 n=1 Tax=Octopus sinensis TaxID=2607531 RepID=A0A7E6FS67_9MOLL|nr:uncharacterized protein LOC118768051 isoform X2 [Octopus sinensis]